ncbi:sigma-70 family RNA polymerase sigma factor [Neobacillus jeddahensis]|uniref:sigma-70 family RNA polymerase sigma factor n=1 Tax=Neobacillus jeddahensis TaxID=1461580 RepID=UPI00058B1FBE|nr:sigma-70 family RNA polymerase sigma factor [Neobacillus jeddahensis]
MSHKFSQNPAECPLTEKMAEDPFWSEYYPKLQRYCRFLAQNTWDGDDLAQETYLKALKYSRQQQKMTTALLNKIAYNHWVDTLRKRRKETFAVDADFFNQVYQHKLDEIKETVEFLLRNFTPKQATILLLKEAFQYHLNEIADLFNSTEMAIKANLHRARKRLEKEEGQSSSVDSFWDEEDRTLLSDVFYEALRDQDPRVVIESISMITIKQKEPMLISDRVRSIPFHSPSGTLCMAA